MKKYFYLLLALPFLWACESEPETPPDEVIRMYQAYVDQNEFMKAGRLSTAAEQKRLEELAQMIAGDMDSTVLETIFQRIDCQITGNTARCACLLEDQYETYSSLFILTKTQGNWLVDLPEEGEIEYDEDMEAIMDSLFQQSSEK
jgi:hypothetical protein